MVAPPLQERQTWLRGPSAISLERHARENRGEGTVAASLCVYDDDRFLESLVEDLLPRLRHLIISHATAPWFGTARPAGFLRAAQTVDRIRSNAPDKVRVVNGAWPSEEAQRNAALQLAATLVPRPTHLLLVDGDEFWHPVELDRALALVYQASQTRRISWVRATMATYFKTVRFVVEPAGTLEDLWLVEVPPENTAVTCGFSEARNWACSSSRSFDRPRVDDRGPGHLRRSYNCQMPPFILCTHDGGVARQINFFRARARRARELAGRRLALGLQSEPRGPAPDAPVGVQAHRLTRAARDAAGVLTCVEIKCAAHLLPDPIMTSTPSTRRLLDGVAVSIPHRSTDPARDTLVDFHTGCDPGGADGRPVPSWSWGRRLRGTSRQTTLSQRRKRTCSGRRSRRATLKVC